LVAAACGEQVAPLTYDTVTTESTSPPVETAVGATESESPAPTLPTDSTGDAWVDATGSLVGMRSECGNLSYVATRPDRVGLVTGVALQGLWESDDSGDTWTGIGEGEGSDPVTLRLNDVLWDPDDPDTFWISGLYNGGGVYQTTDGGKTIHWLGEIRHAETVSVDFADPTRSTLVSPIHETMDVLRSRDKGETWEEISTDLPHEDGYAVAALVLDKDTYVVGVRGGRVPGIFRTVDGGSTWERVYTSSVVGKPLTGSDGRLYWLMDRGAGLVTSDDDGQTWTEVPSSSISPFTPSLVELPDGRFVAVSVSSLIISEDRGISWQSLGPALPYEPSGVLYAPREEAFYAWKFDCEEGENPVRPGTIVRLDAELRPA
jgi:photosystem II stability/assembly factor-like uncharacterized protein